MSPSSQRSALLLTIIGLCCLASFASEAPRRPRGPRNPAPVEEPAPAEASPVILPPATLEQMPARPPVVTLKNGELTIVAQNSSLAEILQAVSSRTGASIDMPEGVDERVVAKLGPGPIRDVLDTLLGGSKLNYVMMGSQTDPAALTQILLFSKPGSDADKKSAAETRTMPRRRRRLVPRRPRPLQRPQLKPQLSLEPKRKRLRPTIRPRRATPRLWLPRPPRRISSAHPTSRACKRFFRTCIPNGRR
jgi:hypothetical protein